MQQIDRAIFFYISSALLVLRTSENRYKWRHEMLMTIKSSFQSIKNLSIPEKIILNLCKSTTYLK